MNGVMRSIDSVVESYTALAGSVFAQALLSIVDRSMSHFVSTLEELVEEIEKEEMYVQEQKDTESGRVGIGGYNVGSAQFVNHLKEVQIADAKRLRNAIGVTESPLLSSGPVSSSGGLDERRGVRDLIENVLKELAPSALSGIVRRVARIAGTRAAVALGAVAGTAFGTLLTVYSVYKYLQSSVEGQRMNAIQNSNVSDEEKWELIAALDAKTAQGKIAVRVAKYHCNERRNIAFRFMSLRDEVLDYVGQMGSMNRSHTERGSLLSSFLSGMDHEGNLQRIEVLVKEGDEVMESMNTLHSRVQDHLRSSRMTKAKRTELVERLDEAKSSLCSQWNALVSR